MQTENAAPADQETNKRGLSSEHRAELEKAGVSEAEINAINAKLLAKGTSAAKAKAKVNIPALIAENRDALKQRSGGKPLFTARATGITLVALGQHVPMRGYNGFGDALGGHGHNLPSVVFQGRRVYDIDYIGATEEEKAKRQEELNAMPFVVIAALVAEIAE